MVCASYFLLYLYSVKANCNINKKNKSVRYVVGTLLVNGG